MNTSILRRLFVAEGGPPPSWRFRTIDYIALGFILLAPEELWRQPKAWYSWGTALVLGIFCAWIGDSGPKVKARALEWWNSPKNLALARAENAKLQAEVTQLKETISQPSKLTIHSAKYGALLPGSKQCDVTNCLRKKINGDGLVLQIQNGNFWADGLNYVPEDPHEGEKKWLEVEYSFDGGNTIRVTRREDYRLVLPEDTFIKEKLESSQEEARYNKSSYESDLRKVEGEWKKCEEEKRATLAQIKDLKTNPNLSNLLSQLQIDALTLAKELRDFLASLPPFPHDPQQHPDEGDYDYQVRVQNNDYLRKVFEENWKKQGEWRLRLMHGYANRKFGERITVLMHRLGEDMSYPAHNATFAEKPPSDAKDISRLAQQMEMIAIWINRTERGEVNLLS